MNKKTCIIFVVILLVVALGVYYCSYQIGYKKGFAAGIQKGSVFSGVGNPLENMPSINPLEGVVNPFKEGYKNPFK